MKNVVENSMTAVVKVQSSEGLLCYQLIYTVHMFSSVPSLTFYLIASHASIGSCELIQY